MLWHNGIGGVLGTVGHRFDPWPGTVGQRSGIAAAVVKFETVAPIWSLALYLHIPLGGQQWKKTNVTIVAQQQWEGIVVTRMQVSSLASLSGLRIGIAVSCAAVSSSCGLGLAFLWLRHVLQLKFLFDACSGTFYSGSWNSFWSSWCQEETVRRREETWGEMRLSGENLPVCNWLLWVSVFKEHS